MDLTSFNNAVESVVNFVHYNFKLEEVFGNCVHWSIRLDLMDGY